MMGKRGVSMVLSQHLIMSKSNTVLMEEKASKLFGAAKMLSSYLKEDFNDLLSFNEIHDLSRKEKILVLNRRLRDFTKLVAQSFPFIGVGYYSKELDAIITYEPSKNSNKVGKSVPDNHLGRQVMAKGKKMVVTGDMVRGNCMACFVPLIRKNKVIGYVWATEPIKEIYKQIRETKRKKSVFTDMKIVIDTLPLVFLSNKIFSDLAISKHEEIVDILKNASFSVNDKINRDICQFIKQIISFLEMAKDYGENILENISAALIIVDPKGKVFFFNESAQWLFKEKDKEKILGRPYYHPLSRFKELGLNEIIKEVFDTGKTYLAQEINYPGQKDKIINLGVCLVKDINKQKIGAMIIVEDISAEKALEQKKKWEKKLATFGELATNLVHEIGNPLTAIKALSQLLPERINDKKFVDRFSREIEKEVERVDKIFKNLFCLIRSSSLRFESTNINAILNEVLFSVEGMVKKQQVNIVRKFSKNLPELIVDKSQIKQVFLNLILNAFHAMPEGGVLEIFTIYERKKSCLKIKFKDNGCGIAHDFLDKVFEPFYTTREDGTGIGLAISCNIIEQHGGYINVESEEGKSSIFTIILPVNSIIEKEDCSEK